MAQPTRKLEVVAEILKHHLARDNNPPLHVKPNAEEPRQVRADEGIAPEDSPHAEGAVESTPGAEGQENPGSEGLGRVPLAPIDEGEDNSTDTSSVNPDKMILYSAFPESNHVIIKILTLLGVPEAEILEVNGNLPLAKRMPQLAKFNDPSGPRILILSGVGMTGLNLQVACYVVILVRCGFLSFAQG